MIVISQAEFELHALRLAEIGFAAEATCNPREFLREHNLSRCLCESRKTLAKSKFIWLPSEDICPECQSPAVRWQEPSRSYDNSHVIAERVYECGKVLRLSESGGYKYDGYDSHCYTYQWEKRERDNPCVASHGYPT